MTGDRTAFIDELRERAVGSVRMAVLLAIASFASFALVDPLLIDGSIRPLLTVRALGIVVLLALGATTLAGDWFRRWSNLVAIAVCVVTSVLVIVLTRMTGGGLSQYHQAMMITFFAFALFPLPWSSLTAGAVFGAMVVVYEVVMVAADVTGPLGTWVSNNAILWASALIAAALVHFSQELRWEEFQNRSQLASARDRLEALDRAKSLFFANISHELRTPLTLALAPVQALLEEQHELTEGQEQHLRLVERNALRLLRLVDDLLELSRADAAALRARRRATDLRAVVATLVTETAPLAARKGLHLELTDGASPPPIHCDPDHIERMLLNLLGNAVKFTPRGGSITVTVGATDDGAEVTVQDSGIGIPANQIDRIFDRFHQVDGSATRAHSGAGIGLALVRELVGLYGGTISATSASGEGARISIRLPRGEPSTEPTVDEAPEDNEHGLPEWHAALRREDGYRLGDLQDATERRLVPRAPKGARPHTVLIVEDNRDMVRFLATLVAAEANVLTATDGALGFRLAQEHRPDLIISDLMMPGLDGLGLVEKLRANEATKATPIILITARDTDEDRVEGRRLGADAYLAKPFRAAELRAAVRALLKRRGDSKTQARQERLESIRYLAGGITDELRAPLQAIEAALEDLRPDDSTRLASIPAELDRLRAALDDLERFAMGRSGPPVTESLRDIVERAAQTAGAPTEGRRLALELTPCSPVAAGAGELERLVAHLLSNALEATRPGGTVTVRTSETDGMVSLSVMDQGPGIPAEHAERIFAPYYSTRQGSRGMGLALSRRLAERNGGSLELSGDGPGATFVLQLPVMPST